MYVCMYVMICEMIANTMIFKGTTHDQPLNIASVCHD